MLGILVLFKVWGLILMIVSEILSPEAILTSIKASSKKRVLQEISIAVENFYGLNQSEVFLALQEREDLGPTGMGHGVAIPHARITSLKSIKGLFAKLIKGAPIAQGKIKKFLNDIKSKDINEKLINFTADTISDIRVSREGQEGLNAFLEKRKPKW